MQGEAPCCLATAALTRLGPTIQPGGLCDKTHMWVRPGMLARMTRTKGGALADVGLPPGAPAQLRVPAPEAAGKASSVWLA